jgi:glycosyltransferase involved in cell wall biosynthesis
MSDELVLLRETRRRLAEFWRSAEANELPRAFAGDAGRVHRVVMNGAVRYAPLDASERTLVDSLDDRARAGVTDASSAGGLLAAMLYRRAHQLDLNADLTRLPPWLVKDFVAWLIAPVAFFTEPGESARYAKHLTGVLQTIVAGVSGPQVTQFWASVAMLAVQRLDCTPAYANDENLYDLQRFRGELLGWVARASGGKLEQTFASPPAGRKKRVGLVARHLRPSAETFALLPVYEHLKDEFDVVLYICEPGNHPLAQYCAGRATAARVLPPDLGSRQKILLADDLDLLFYGTNLTTASHDLVLLAQHRLARVQATSVANVVTTGIGNVDYFLTGTSSDPSPDAASHYMEKLFRLDGSAHCFSYGHGATSNAKATTRAELGLRDDQVVFASGANLYKITPELLGAWAKILAGAPSAALMLFPFGPNWYPAYPVDEFTRHVKVVLGDVAGDRVYVMNPQPAPDRAQLREYYRVADVYLDSFPFCGSTSLIEPLEVGLPVITRGGATFRSAMGGAMLREIGMDELVAGDAAKYAAIAIELANNSSRRAELSKRTRDRMLAKPSFLDSAGYGKRIAAAFKAMLAEKGVAS